MPKSSNTFKPIKDKNDYLIGNNSIYVSKDTTFEIKISDIHPGWIHTQKDGSLT